MKSWLFRILGIAPDAKFDGIERFIANDSNRIDSLAAQVGKRKSEDVTRYVSYGGYGMAFADKIQEPPIEDRILAISEYLGIKFVQKSEQPAKVVAVSTRNGSKGGATPKKKPTKKN